MSIAAALMLPHPPLIVPEVGRGEEQKIHKTIDAYKKAAGMAGALRPEQMHGKTVITSSHGGNGTK